MKTMDDFYKGRFAALSRMAQAYTQQITDLQKGHTEVLEALDDLSCGGFKLPVNIHISYGLSNSLPGFICGYCGDTQFEGGMSEIKVNGDDKLCLDCARSMVDLGAAYTWDLFDERYHNHLIT